MKKMTFVNGQHSFWKLTNKNNYTPDLLGFVQDQGDTLKAIRIP